MYVHLQIQFVFFKENLQKVDAAETTDFNYTRDGEVILLRDSAHKLTLSDHNPRLSPKTRHKKYKRQSHVINYHTLHDGA